MQTIDLRSYDWVYQLGNVSLSVLTTATVTIVLLLYGLAVGHSGTVTALGGSAETALFLGLLIGVIFAPISLGIRWVLIRRLAD